MVNDNLVLITGSSATGKSTSLMDLENPEGVLYLNCESGKKLPFPAKFMESVVTDPFQVPSAFAWAEMPVGSEGGPQTPIHTIVIDSLTFLLDMFESLYIIPAVDGREAWGQFALFFKNLMQVHVAKSTKNVIFTAHTLSTYNEAKMAFDVKVPVKGALKNNGIESYFSCVISTKKVETQMLKELGIDTPENTLLTITPKQELQGVKYVFQTDITKATVHETIRGPIQLWNDDEVFIDNNLQNVINRLKHYYG